MLSRRLPSISEPNAWTRALTARRAAGADLVDLTESNPTRLGLGGAGPAELAALADPAGGRYEPDPRGLPAARAAVAADASRRCAALDHEDVVLTASTSEAYAHLFRLLADPGDAVLAPAPSYPLVEPIAALEGVRVATYRIVWDGRWHVDRASLEAAMTATPRVRAIVVVQPNHPTGSCLAPDESAWLETLAERHGVALISDEVFADFPWPGVREPLPTLQGARRAPTFVLGGLSKSCGMPQLKLGWILLAGPCTARAQARAGLEWIADLFLSVGTPVQLALPELLAAGAGFRDRARRRVADALARLESFAAERGDVDLLRGEGGWSAVLRLPARHSGEAWALALLERGVVVHPGHFYDLDGPHLVVGLLQPPDRFDEALRRAGAALAEGCHV